MNDRNALRRLFPLVLCLLVSVGFMGCESGCGGNSDTSSDATALKATKMAAILPGDLALVAATQDVFGLKKEFSSSDSWKALSDTSFVDDLMAMDEFGSVRQLVSDVGRFTSMPLGQVVADSFLEGPGTVGLRWRGNRPMEYLLVKELDLAQKSVVKTVAIWKEFGQSQVIPGANIQLYSSQIGSRTVYYYIAGNIWALGSHFGLMIQSLYLLLDAHGATNDQAALGELMTSRGITIPKALRDVRGLSIDETGPLSVTLNLDVLRDEGRDRQNIPWTSDVQGLKLQYVASSGGEDGVATSNYELALLRREAFGIEAERPYTHHRYISKLVNVYAGFSQLPIDWIAARVESRLGDYEDYNGSGLSDALGFNFDIQKLAASTFAGDGFYAFQGLNSRGINHVVGLKLKPEADPFDGLKAVWKSLFRGEFEVSTLQHLEGARLVCGNDGMAFEPFCFALHGDYLLVGLRPSVRESLKSAVGKAPTVRDRVGLGQEFATSETYVGALLLDIPGLSNALFRHVKSLSGPGLKRGHVEEVLGPWFDGLRKIEGAVGVLQRQESGSVVGTLDRF